MPVLLAVSSWKMDQNIKISEYIYIIMFFVIYPVRIYFSGGIYAPGLMCAIIGFLLFSNFKNKYIQICYFLLVISSLCFFSILGGSEHEYSLHIRVLTYMFIFFFMFCQFFYRYQLNEQMREELLRIERKSTEGAMITTLCHEINNPLSIMLMGGQRLKGEGADDKLIGMMERSGDRITSTLSKIQKIRSNDLDIVSYSGGIEMYNIHDDEERE
jgi:signal transduction histidine kinase